MKTRITNVEIYQICEFVEKHFHSWVQDPLLTIESPIYIQRGTKLARNLQINREKNGKISIFFLLNRIKQGDPLLGQGSFKKVKKAFNLLTGQTVARISELMKTSQSDKSYEFELTSSLNDLTGIAKTFDNSLITYQNKGVVNKKIAFMQIYYQGGNLGSLLGPNMKEEVISIPEQLSITEKLLIGGVHLKYRGVIHRDLKPDNILLMKNCHGEVVDVAIADFGLSCKINEEEKKTKSVGTPLFISPEYAKALIKKCYANQSLLAAQKSNNILDIKAAELEIIEADKRLSNATTHLHDVWAIGLMLFFNYFDDVDEWHEIPSFLTSFKDYSEVIFTIANLKEGWLPKPYDLNSEGYVVWEMLKVNPKHRIDCQAALEKILYINSFALRLNREKLSTTELVIFTKKLLFGVTQLHQKGMIHRDIKPNNLFLKRNNLGEIIDVHLVLRNQINCHYLNEKQKMDIKGTPFFTSPEYAKAVLRKGQFEHQLLGLDKDSDEFKLTSKEIVSAEKAIAESTTFLLDAWSVGMTLFFAYMNEIPEWKDFQLPFFKTNPLFQLASLKEGWLPQPAEKKSVGYIIWKMLQVDIKKRLDCETAYAKIDLFQNS